MGDSGSQVLGFTLGALGLATSWKVAETTVATLMLPILVLAVPILDTALVTAVRMRERRPIHQGGKDHTSHRLVRGGLSEQKTVVLLAAIAAGLGATSLAYSVLGDYRITLVGVLVTFALLVQFAGFLVDLERGSTSETEAVPGGWMLRTVVLHRRRLLEVLLDFVLISACFACRLSPDRAGHGHAVPAARLHGRPPRGAHHPLHRIHPPRPLPGDLALRRLTRGGLDRARRPRLRTGRGGDRGGDDAARRLPVQRVRARRAALHPCGRCVEVRRARALPGPLDAARARRPPDADRRCRPLGAEPAPRAPRDTRRARRRLRRRRPAPASPAAARRARPRRDARHRPDPRRRPARHGAGHHPAGPAPTASTLSCVPAPPSMSPAGSSGARPTSTPSRCWAPRRVTHDGGRARRHAAPGRRREDVGGPADECRPGRRRLPLAERSLRVADPRPRDSVALHRRAQVHPDRAQHRRDGHGPRSGTTRSPSTRSTPTRSRRSGGSTTSTLPTRRSSTSA